MGEGPGGPLHLSALWLGCAAGRLRALRRRRKPHIFEPRTQREDQQRHSEKRRDRVGSTWTDYRALQRVRMPRTGTSLSPLWQGNQLRVPPPQNQPSYKKGSRQMGQEGAAPPKLMMIQSEIRFERKLRVNFETHGVPQGDLSQKECSEGLREGLPDKMGMPS